MWRLLVTFTSGTCYTLSFETAFARGLAAIALSSQPVLLTTQDPELLPNISDGLPSICKAGHDISR